MKYDAEVAVVGAGPIGLEMAIALKTCNISYLIFDKSQAAQMVYNYPPMTKFFSAQEKLGIANTPIFTFDQQKCTREQYLAHVRCIVSKYELRINTFEEVLKIRKLNEGFEITTRKGLDNYIYTTHFLVIATGSTSSPRMLGIPGEHLPHVSTRMEDPHKYFHQKVVVIGGRNSAAESAMRCFYAGAHVSIVYRNAEFNPEIVKYWILPDLMSRIHDGTIIPYFDSVVQEIKHKSIVLKNLIDESFTEIPADFVIKAIGFNADMTLCQQMGVSINKNIQGPDFNSDTMETTIPGLYVVGTITGGTQKRFIVFIENSHIHVEKVIKRITSLLGIENKWLAHKPALGKLDE